MLNPFDLYAIEEGVRLAERLRDLPARTLALSMGPQQATEALREALALGIDEAQLLSDPCFAGGDTWATARVLAAAVRKSGARLVLCGKQAADGDTAQVGPELAAQLGWPQVCYATGIHEISSDYAVVERQLDDGRETLRVELPAVLTVVKEINTPRLPTLPGKLRARAATIAVLNAQALELSPESVGLPGSPTRVRRIFTPPARGEVVLLDPADPAAASRRILEIIARHATKKA